MKISVITVNFNDRSGLQKTMMSVISQTYADYEYIIIDGQSKDATLSIIEKYKSFVDVLISEPDKGLYDAMNKGLQLAKGQFVWFINSGDQLYSENTVAQIEQLYQQDYSIDVFYGQTQLIDEKGNIVGMRKKTAPDNLNANSLKMGLMVCHQSILIRKDIADKYDLQLKVSADYLWVLSALEKAKNICNT